MTKCVNQKSRWRTILGCTSLAGLVYLTLLFNGYVVRLYGLQGKLDRFLASQHIDDTNSIYYMRGKTVLKSYSINASEEYSSVRLLSKEMDEQFNKEYYESIDKEDGFSPSHESNSLYPRHPINTEVRTSLNDVYLFVYHDKPNSYGYSPSYKQSFDLEYYSGSVKVNNPIRISNSTGFDITIISQTTKSRLSYIPSLLERWGGPISLTIFVYKNDLSKIRELIHSSNYPDRLLLTLYIVNNADSGCVYRDVMNRTQCVKESVYPINRLRNLSIKRVYTTHFVVLDMDSFPSIHAYHDLMSLPKEYLENPHFVTILPAFSFSRFYVSRKPKMTPVQGLELTKEKMPTSKEQLVKELKEGKMTIFRPTTLTHEYLLPEWYNETTLQPVIYIPCLKKHFLEPYVMVKKSSYLPSFYEEFFNYGLNKVQWIENLRYEGYEFYISNHAFLVDVPHRQTSYADKYNSLLRVGTNEMLKVYRRLLRDMRQRPDRSRELICCDRMPDFKMHRS